MLLPKTYLVRMKEQERYRWWKPIVAFLLACLLFVLFMGIVFFATGFSGVPSPSGPFSNSRRPSRQMSSCSKAWNPLRRADSASPFFSVLSSFFSLPSGLP